MASDDLGSAGDVYRTIRELADALRVLEVRLRAVEDKLIQSEGGLRNLTTKTDLQLARLVAEAESERRTRQEANREVKEILVIVQSSMYALEGRLGDKFEKINRQLVWAAGFLSAVVVLVNLALRFIDK